MKKTYIIPETEIVNIAPSSLIANSPFDDGSTDLQDLEAPEGSDGLVKGRGFNIWGDDDWDD